MTVPLSPHKVRTILRHYFTGLPQVKTAKKAEVDQSTVSLWVTRFKDRVDEVGLVTAGKDFGVFHEVDALRSLSVELAKSKLTTVEAQHGLDIMKAFIKLGVDSKQHTTLIKVCGKIDDPGFIYAAVKLAKIEAESGMSYEEALACFEKATEELPAIENKLQEKQAHLKAVSDSLSQRKKELANLEQEIAQFEQEAKNKGEELKNNLEAKMKQFSVTKKEIEDISALKAQLQKTGLDIPTLIKLAKEFNYGKG